jgi:hypothetical protein
VSNLPQNHEPFRKAFAYRRRRAFFSFRRRSDLAWFAINVCLFIFSLTVVIFKVKFDPPVVIEKIVEKTEIHQIPATPEFAPAPVMPEGGTIESPAPTPTPSETKPVVKDIPKPASKETPAPAAQAPKKPAGPPFKAPPAAPYDFLLSEGSWKTAANKKGKMSLVNVETDTGRILRLTYEFANGAWAEAAAEAAFDFSAFKKLQINYTLAEGRPGGVELLVRDADGGELRVALERASDGQWHRTDVPISKNAPVDWRRVKQVAIIITLNPKSKNPQAAAGTFWINQLRIVS